MDGCVMPSKEATHAVRSWQPLTTC
jgi:hypothetical protein